MSKKTTRPRCALHAALDATKAEISSLRIERGKALGPVIRQFNLLAEPVVKAAARKVVDGARTMREGQDMLREIAGIGAGLYHARGEDEPLLWRVHELDQARSAEQIELEAKRLLGEEMV